jgi:hypothetical protein
MKHRSTQNTVLLPKRAVMLFVLLLVALGSQAQLLKKLEYFFDKDPGIGNGTAMVVKQQASLDTSLKLNITALANGLHTVYLRAQDTANAWSLTYSASFVKYPGSDSVMKITAIEYFFDTDPGFGSGTSLTLSPADNISNLFNIVVPDNGKDTRKLYVRAKDSYGRWSTLYDTDIDMCKLYKAKPNFGFIRYGSEYSFIDSSRTNTAHSLIWRYDNSSSDTMANPVHSFGIGKHSVKLVAGKGCRADSMVQPLYTALESYSPKKVMAGGDISLDLYGGGFDKDVTVTLVDSAGKNYASTSGAASTNKAHYFARFDLHDVALGTEKKWNIKLHFPNANYDTVLQEAITVLPKPADTTQIEPKITVSINMPRNTGSNTWHHGSYTLTNTGFVIAKMVPFNFSVDDQLQDFKLVNVHISTDTTVISKAIQDSMPQFERLPVIFGDRHPCRVYGLLVPEIGPGQTITISFDFLTPTALTAELHCFAWTGNRMLGSPTPAAWVNCITSAVGLVGSILNTIPIPQAQVAGRVLSCGSALTSQLFNLFTASPQTSADVNQDMVNMGSGMANTLVNCLGIGDFNTVKQITNITKYAGQIDNGINYLQGANAVITNGFGADSCQKCWNDPWFGTTRNFGSADPNEIAGPAGYDSVNHYLNANSRLSYQVSFENKPDAGRAAQRVTVKDTLDASKMDLSTFTLQSFIIADSIFAIPSFRNEYTATVDLSARRNVLVRFNAKLDTATHVLTTDFISLDPVSKQVITDTVLKGFLPPDTDQKSGRASLIYSISQKTNNKTGDSVTNRASIIFDNNAPLLTNTWLNIIDTTRPVGSIASAKLVSDTSFHIYFSGNDVGSGIRSYKIYASVNNGPYRILQKDISDSLRITGAKDSTYRLYAVPLDNVNNTQLKNATAELTVTLFALTAIKGDSVVCAGSSTAFSNTTSGGSWSSSNSAVATVDANGTVKGITAGTVTITYSVTKDYFTRAVTKTIRVKPLPAKTGFNTTVRAFCNKDSLAVSITGIQAKDSVFWYIGSKIDSTQSIQKTFRDSALVKVFRKDSTSCGVFSDTIQLVRIVPPTPKISQVADTLVSTAATTYQWYLNGGLLNGATNQRYKIRNSATYTVKVTDTNGCQSDLSAAFAVVITAISNTVMNNKDWKVFPNPVSNGMLYIQRNGIPSGSVQASITGTDGKLAAQKKITGNTQWDVRHLAPGIYYLQIMEQKAVSVYQFIKL